MDKLFVLFPTPECHAYRIPDEPELVTDLILQIALI
jgi:hypothetical protein